jgi:hypothetical protein
MLDQQRKKHRTSRLTSEQEQLLHDLGALTDPAPPASASPGAEARRDKQ